MKNNTTVIRTVNEMIHIIAQEKKNGKIVGLVPTMGYLHEGHLSLVKQAQQESDVVVLSVFVNPTQFGPNEDYDAYPRDEAHDIKLAEEAGVRYVFMPSVAEMYPRSSDIRILPGKQALKLCGAARPGHFDGVLQVVLKLFNIVMPQYSYFGMKDAQQLAIIESFVEDYNVPVIIRRGPTVRESDGLAKSSRNVRLTPAERTEAPSIYKGLVYGAELLREGHSAEEVVKRVTERLEGKCGGTIDYVSLLTYPNLDDYKGNSDEVLLACAVQCSKVRLIDNMILKAKG